MYLFVGKPVFHLCPIDVCLMFATRLDGQQCKVWGITIYCHQTANIRLADKAMHHSNTSNISKSLKKKQFTTN